MNAVEEAFSLLPQRLCDALSPLRRSREALTEIRLRRFLPLSVSTFSGNIFVNEQGERTDIAHAICAKPSEISHVVNRLSAGSLYRCMDTIKQGFLVTPHGVRAGLCGEILTDEKGVAHIDTENFTGINLRIPHLVRGAADALIDAFRGRGVRSVLLYSPPGEGKTTVLRDLAIRLSAGALSQLYRVAVVDERKELFPMGSNFRESAGLLDVLSGYSKAEGIELATRLFSPEILICDEIGGADGPEEILSAQNSGVLFIASAHARDKEDLYRKPRIQMLLSGGVFSLLCGLKRDHSAPGGIRFHVTEL